MVAKNIEDFIVVNDELYYQGGGGVMARAVSVADATEAFYVRTMTLDFTDTYKYKGNLPELVREAAEL